MRIERGPAQRLAPRSLEPHQRARNERLGGGIHRHFVGIDPGMAALDALVAGGLELHHRPGFGRAHLSRSRALAMGGANCGAMSQGNRIQVSWLTSVTKLS